MIIGLIAAVIVIGILLRMFWNNSQNINLHLSSGSASANTGLQEERTLAGVPCAIPVARPKPGTVTYTKVPTKHFGGHRGVSVPLAHFDQNEDQLDEWQYGPNGNDGAASRANRMLVAGNSKAAVAAAMTKEARAIFGPRTVATVVTE